MACRQPRDDQFADSAGGRRRVHIVLDWDDMHSGTPSVPVAIPFLSCRLLNLPLQRPAVNTTGLGYPWRRLPLRHRGRAGDCTAPFRWGWESARHQRRFLSSEQVDLIALELRVGRKEPQILRARLAEELTGTEPWRSGPRAIEIARSDTTSLRDVCISPALCTSVSPALPSTNGSSGRHGQVSRGESGARQPGGLRPGAGEGPVARATAGR
jgi:hypothetical protein